MSTAAPKGQVTKQLVAQDFAANAKGKLTQAQIDSISKSLLANTTPYPATISVADGKLQVKVTGGETFTGNAVGISIPPSPGDVYTDNIANLYANTVSFQYQATAVYLSILFFDGGSNLLGSFQGGAVPTVTAGGGKGHWSS